MAARGRGRGAGSSRGATDTKGSKSIPSTVIGPQASVSPTDDINFSVECSGGLYPPPLIGPPLWVESFVASRRRGRSRGTRSTKGAMDIRGSESVPSTVIGLQATGCPTDNINLSVECNRGLNPPPPRRPQHQDRRPPCWEEPIVAAKESHRKKDIRGQRKLGPRVRSAAHTALDKHVLG